MIFRKVADVKREKELAEKRKNDPPLDLSQDHPVRKLISRFRKFSENKHGANSADTGEVEKGEQQANNTKDTNLQNAALTGSSLKLNGGVAKVINVTEKNNVKFDDKLCIIVYFIKKI